MAYQRHRLPLGELSARFTARFNECEAAGGHKNSGRYVTRGFPDGDRELYICARCEVPIVGKVIRWKINSVPPKERPVPVIYDKTCVACGRAFRTSHWRKSACSPACVHQVDLAWRRAQRAEGRFPKVCPQCGKDFNTHRLTVQYCSIRCGVLARHARRRAAACTSTQTECLRGHPLAGDNLYVDPNGHRECRACRRMRNRLLKERAA